MSDEASEQLAEFTFACPECDESMVVDSQMKEVLLENGCVVCGSQVADAAFASDSVEKHGRDDT